MTKLNYAFTFEDLIIYNDPIDKLINYTDKRKIILLSIKLN